MPSIRPPASSGHHLCRTAVSGAAVEAGGGDQLLRAVDRRLDREARRGQRRVPGAAGWIGRLEEAAQELDPLLGAGALEVCEPALREVVARDVERASRRLAAAD